MGEAFIVRRGGVSSEETAAPTITIISETFTDVTFTLTNNDDNTAFITFEIDDTLDVIELAAAATSSNITVALAAGTYTLSAFATVVGKVATQSTAAVEIVVIPEYEELFSTTVATATTQIDITGLNIGKADNLRLVFTAIGVTGGGSFALFPNNLTTQTNYHTQILEGSGSSLVAGRFNINSFSNPAATLKHSGFVDIKISNNDRFVAQSQEIFSIGSVAASIRNTSNNIVGTQSVTSITSLKIVSSGTNGIGIGSKIALYKVTEAA